MSIKTKTVYMMVCSIFLVCLGLYGFISEAVWVKSIFYILLAYIIFSVKVVRPEELGAILFLGKPLVEVGPGPHIIPFGFYSLIKETALVVQEQYPGEPETIDRTESDIVAPGKVFPMRVTTGASDNPKDALDHRVTAEITAIARKRIKRGSFIKFLTTIGTMEEANRQIRDTVESVIKIEFPKRSPKNILLELNDINEELEKAVIKLTESWGIEVKDISLIDIDLGKKVNKALRDIPAAVLEKQAVIEKAHGERVRLTQEGLGTADAELALLTARAKGEKLILAAKAIGTKKLAEATNTPEGQIVLWLQTMQAGFEKANHTIIPSGELFSAMAGVNAILEKTKGGSK